MFYIYTGKILLSIISFYVSIIFKIANFSKSLLFEIS